MKRQFSAGGIVYKKVGKEYQFLLIRNKSMKDPNVDYWGFPKGHLEAGEKSLEAALREVAEETGVEAKMVDKVGVSQYVFSLEGEKVFKSVTIFLMEYVEGEIVHQESEVGEAGWVEYEEALERLSFRKDKDLLTKAWDMLQAR